MVLADQGFWPGVDRLLESGLINDFWTWPPTDEKALALRLNRMMEKIIFKMVAEQKSSETERIVNRLCDLKKHQASARADGSGFS